MFGESLAKYFLPREWKKEESLKCKHVFYHVHILINDMRCSAGLNLTLKVCRECNHMEIKDLPRSCRKCQICILGVK